MVLAATVRAVTCSVKKAQGFWMPRRDDVPARPEPGQQEARRLPEWLRPVSRFLLPRPVIRGRYRTPRSRSRPLGLRAGTSGAGTPSRGKTTVPNASWQEPNRNVPPHCPLGERRASANYNRFSRLGDQLSSAVDFPRHDGRTGTFPSWPRKWYLAGVNSRE
jgi:hypothetical protein